MIQIHKIIVAENLFLGCKFTKTIVVEILFLGCKFKKTIVAQKNA
jgi:hypothetical protein